MPGRGKDVLEVVNLDRENKEVRKSAKLLKRLWLKHSLLGGPRESGYFVSDNRCAVEIPQVTAVRAFVRAGIVPPYPMDSWRGRRGPEGEEPWKDRPEYAERTTKMLEGLLYEVHDTGVRLQAPGSVRVLLIASPEPEYALVASHYWPVMRQAEFDLHTKGTEQPIAGNTGDGYLRLVMPMRVDPVFGLAKLIPPAEMAELLGVKYKEATNATAQES